MRRTTALAAAVLALAVAAPASAQDNRFEEQVAFQMSIVESFARSVGFEKTHELLFSSLDEGESETFTLNVDAGMDYRMIALCDEDCDDIDIYLEDGAGNVIDQDVSVNDAPVVSLSARADTSYRLRVRMYTCSVEPCYFGVAIFGR